MLQQTQVKTVLPYWERWMKALPDLSSLAKAKGGRLHKLWEGLGYYSRVRNLQRAARIIRDDFGSEFPRDFNELLALPGIGRYTAGAICSIAFNQPTPALDGNVMRVLARLYGIAGDPRAPKVNIRLWRLAEDMVRQAAEVEAGTASEAGLRNPSRAGPGACSCLNQALMELGALVCAPREPSCAACPIARYCVAFREDRIPELPSVRRGVGATPRRFVAFVVENQRRLLARRRPAGVVNAHLWELPNLELSPADSDLVNAARRVLKVQPKHLEPLGTINHSITRYSIRLEAYRVAIDRGANISTRAGRWLDRKRLGRLAFTSAHRKILRRLGIFNISYD
jgi:A/G-specific adenine glycosylase